MLYAYLPSFVLLSAAIAYHYLSLRTPPVTSKAEQKKGNAKNRAALPARYINYLYSPLVYGIFALEFYAIYISGTSSPSTPSSPFLSSLCPPKILKTLYPSGTLPIPIILSLVSIIIGGYARKACYDALGPLFKWEVSIQPNHKLITTYPYNIVRHPAYVGSILVNSGYIGFIHLRGTVLQECVVPTYGWWARGVVWFITAFRGFVMVWLVSRVESEDEMLKLQFGEVWEMWAAKTRYKLIPFVY